MTNDPDAIACNLVTADYQDRLAWIAELNAAALLRCRRRGRQVELSYDPTAASRVREFVRRERQCCPFLTFRMAHRDHELVLSIEVPAAVADNADALFAPYTTSAE